MICLNSKFACFYCDFYFDYCFYFVFVYSQGPSGVAGKNGFPVHYFHFILVSLILITNDFILNFILKYIVF